MPGSSNYRNFARFAATLALIAMCGSVAQSSPLLRFAALTPPVDLPDAAPALRGPFGLTFAPNNPFAARWQNLQPILRVEAEILSLCRINPDGCPAAAAKFLGVIEAARALDGRARIGAINRAVNLAIRPMSDLAQFGVVELWASPLTTFASGAGDCEDYAIAKYIALREAGAAEADLRLVVVRDGDSQHAVAAARTGGDWLILDNRHMRLLTDNDAVNLMMPLFALGGPDNGPARAMAVSAATSGGGALNIPNLL